MTAAIEAGRTATVWAQVERGETVEGLLDGIWDYWHVLISQLPAVESANLVRYLAANAPARDLVMLSLERLRVVSSLERIALIDVLATALSRLKTQRWRFMLQCSSAISSLVRLEFDTANPSKPDADSDEDEHKERSKAPKFEANVLNEPRIGPAKDVQSAIAHWQSHLRLFLVLNAVTDLNEAELFIIRGLAFRLLADALTMYLPVDVEPLVLALQPLCSEPQLLFASEAAAFVPFEEGEEEEVFASWTPEGVAYAAALMLPRLPIALSRRFVFRLLEPLVNSLLRVPAAASALPTDPPPRVLPADPHILGEELYANLLKPLVGREPPLALPPLDEKAVEQQIGEAGRLQALINFIVNCPIQARRTALWKGVRGQVSLYDAETRLRLIRFLLKHCPYGHVSALLLGWVKDELARAPQPEPQTNVFVKELRSFFPIVFQSLRPGAELEHFDQLMAAANFARFLLLWDKKNATRVLTEDALRELSDIFLEPLRLSLTAQLASPLPNEAHRTNLQLLADICDRTLELLRPAAV